MASDNSKMKVVAADQTSAIIGILNDTTANADQKLDRLARLVLGNNYQAWVQAYRARTGKPWLGG